MDVVPFTVKLPSATVKSPVIVRFPGIVTVPAPAAKVTPPAPAIVTSPTNVGALLNCITTVPVNVCPFGIVAAPAVKAPAVFVNPAVNTIFAGFVTAVDSQVPAVLVTGPVNVVVPVPSLSVKFAPIVDVPVPSTVKSPEVPIVSGPEVISKAGNDKFALPLSVRPAAPATVKFPEPVSVIFSVRKVIGVVAVIVLPVAMVALGTLKVPAVFTVKPKLNMICAFGIVEKLTLPVQVNKLLKVLVPVFSLSINVPETLVAPATLIFPDVLRVKPPVTVKVDGKARLTAPPMVVPPAPAKVIGPAPVSVIPFEKLSAVVAVTVNPVAIVAFAHVNVPDVLVMPPLNTGLVVANADKLNVPAFVTNPVNVVASPS